VNRHEQWVECCSRDAAQSCHCAVASQRVIAGRVAGNVLQGTSLSSAEGVSRYSEPVSAVFATPKARLFHLLKSHNASVSRARLSLSHDDRTSAPSQHEDTQTCAADTSFSFGFDLLSPQCHDENDGDDDCHSVITSRDTATESRAAESCAQSLFTSDEDETCGAKDNCFLKPSTSRQR